MKLRNLRYRQLMRYVFKRAHAGYQIIGDGAIERVNRQTNQTAYRRNRLEKIGRL